MTERDSIREFCRPRDEPCDWSRQNGVCSRPDIGAEGQAERAAKGSCDGASRKSVIGKMAASGFEPYAVCTTKAVEEVTGPTIYYTSHKEEADGTITTRPVGCPVTEEEYEEFQARKAKPESLISSSSSPDHRT